MGEPGRPGAAPANGGRPLACVDCLGAATIQVLSPYGVPAGTFCDEHWQAREAFGRAVNEMLASGIERLEAANRAMSEPEPAEILRQRLDEDEAAAKAAGLEAPSPWKGDYGDLEAASGDLVVDGVGYGGAAWKVDALDHIARHDPARVLAEVAAKRAILARYEEACLVQSPGPGDNGYREGLEAAIQCLASSAGG